MVDFPPWLVVRTGATSQMVLRIGHNCILILRLVPCMANEAPDACWPGPYVQHLLHQQDTVVRIRDPWIVALSQVLVVKPVVMYNPIIRAQAKDHFSSVPSNHRFRKSVTERRRWEVQPRARDQSRYFLAHGKVITAGHSITTMPGPGCQTGSVNASANLPRNPRHVCLPDDWQNLAQYQKEQTKL